MPGLIPSFRFKLVLAFFLIYFIWGSTYLAIRYAIETMPPFFMAGIRFLLAGFILYIIMRLRGVLNPSFAQWRRSSVVGSFLFLGGNGLVVWAEQFVNSGLAALLVSTLPLWLIALDWLWAKGPAPAPRALLGIALGIVGMFLLVDPASIVGSGVNTMASLVIIAASVFWAIGSIYSRKVALPRSIFMSAACQMIGGGISLLLVSLLSGELNELDIHHVSLVSFSAFGYLIIFGSMIAISAYAWLLQNASAASVSTYAFVNPAVAIFLGWLIADEAINAQIALGAGIILLGVFLVISTQFRRRSA